MAHKIRDEWSLSRPVKTRAMAPEWTIGIVAETTTRLEPLWQQASREKGRRHMGAIRRRPCGATLDSARRESRQHRDGLFLLAESAEGVERRVAFQPWFVQYVDHGIASTINLPAWGSARNNDATV